MKNSCKGCVHWKTISHCWDLKACHYYLDTGELRGCPADKCDKKDTDETHRVRCKSNFNKFNVDGGAVVKDKYWGACCTDDYDEASDIYNTDIEEQRIIKGYMYGDDEEEF